MKISVFGAGAWGTALASVASVQHDVMLWTRQPGHALQMAHYGHNHAYLPGIQWPANMRISADHTEAVRHGQGGLCVIATPMAGLRAQLTALGAGSATQQPALWLCKGFEADSGALGHEIARAVRPHAACGVLSGPSFALEVARGQATALVVASADTDLAASAVAAFHSETLRVYTSTDLVGVEVGGAVKNVLAIAVGVLDGMAEQAGDSASRLGLNARAALITRGLAEMTRLGVALGGRAETFMGLSGLGDLVLTATGHLSRNRQVGLLLARGLSLEQALQSLGHVAEGVHSAPTVWARARRLEVDMPITEAVVELLAGRTAVATVLGRLMGRDARAE